jgi:hypothetical protein
MRRHASTDKCPVVEISLLRRATSRDRDKFSAISKEYKLDYEALRA